MKYVVERIENDILVLENIDNGEIIEVYKKNIPLEVYEGNIISYSKEDGYLQDIETEDNRRKNLRERLERLKRLKKWVEEWK